jgi:DNA primase
MEIAPLQERIIKTEADGDVLAYVSQFVELKSTRSGGVGHCPFHDDEHMSFSVNRQGNYWHCFAGCGGGRIDQFEKKWNELEEGR